MYTHGFDFSGDHACNGPNRIFLLHVNRLDICLPRRYWFSVHKTASLSWRPTISQALEESLSDRRIYRDGRIVVLMGAFAIGIDNSILPQHLKVAQ